MKIKAGMQEIAIKDLRVSGDYAVLTLDGEALITPEQMQALKAENWSVYAESENNTQPDEQQEAQPIETLLREYSGYNEPLELNLTMKRGVALQDEVMQQQGALKEMAQSLPDEAAVQYKEYFDEWAPAIEYKKGKRLRYDDNLFKVLQAHMSQEQSTPSVDTASLYTLINDPNEDDIPDWTPGSWDKGAKVRHKGKVWISGIDNNVYEPGGEGIYDPIWKKVEVE